MAANNVTIKPEMISRCHGNNQQMHHDNRPSVYAGTKDQPRNVNSYHGNVRQ